MRGVGTIAIALTASVLFADAAAARSKPPRPHQARAVASDRAPSGAEVGKDGAVTQLDRILGTRIKSICRGC